MTSTHIDSQKNPVLLDNSSAADIGSFWSNYCDGDDKREIYELLPALHPFVICYKHNETTTQELITNCASKARKILETSLFIDKYQSDCFIIKEADCYRFQFPFCRVDDKISSYLANKIKYSLKSNKVDVEVNVPDKIRLYTDEVVEFISHIGTSYKKRYHSQHFAYINCLTDPISNFLPIFLSSYYIADNDVVSINESTFEIDELLHFIEIDDSNINRKIEIGKVLHNQFKGSDVGFDMWVSYVLGSDCDEETRRMEWNSFADKPPLTIRTLAWIVKEDTPDKYKIWTVKRLHDAYVDASTLTDVNIAKVIHRALGMDLVCTDVSRDIWYQMEGGLWKKYNSRAPILKKIINELPKTTAEQIKRIQRIVDQSDDDMIKELNRKLIEDLGKMSTMLESSSKLSSVIGLCKFIFYDQEFEKKLDANPDLFSVKNGVLEMVGDKVIHRSGRPEDYLSNCAGVHYDKNYSMDHPNVIACLKWMRQLFKEEDTFRFFMKLCASLLRSKNSDKMLLILTGKGNCGKSMVKKLLEAVMSNDYMHTPSMDILVESKGGGGSGPSPQLAILSKKKLSMCQESDSNLPLSAAATKRATGGDSYYARGLYSDGGMMELVCKFWMMCNGPPIWDSPDDAVMNRGVFLPFYSLWPVDPDDAPDDPEEQDRLRIYKKDSKFEEKIPKLAIAFLWLMVEWYPIYINEGVEKQPEIVANYKKKYWEDNNPFIRFANNNVTRHTVERDGKKIRDPEAKLTTNDAYRAFSDWYKLAFPNSKVVNSTVFEAQFTEQLKQEPKGRCWEGIRLKTIHSK